MENANLKMAAQRKFCDKIADNREHALRRQRKIFPLSVKRRRYNNDKVEKNLGRSKIRCKLFLLELEKKLKTCEFDVQATMHREKF